MTDSNGYAVNYTGPNNSHTITTTYQNDNLHGKATIMFTLKEQVGALAEALKIFKESKVNLSAIESRPSRRHIGNYEFLVECEPAASEDPLNRALERLKEQSLYVIVKSQDPTADVTGSIPWFPKKIKDLDQFANRVLSYGAELDSDHPGFTDPVYRARRKEFADIAISYRHGTPIPRVTYTEAELATWRTIFTQLRDLYPTHACAEFNYVFPLLEQNCNYNADTIPQLQDVSEFLKECTGFTLRPVAGLLSSRDFLAGLAFRVFHSTQYIRHGSQPMYTPEPDVCHELLGHVPLFADQDFANFSQEIGLVSLGADDETVKKLATLYWFTVEFGVCQQANERKAYGAGLLSSFGELQYCLTDEPKIEPFEPSATAVQEYPITRYQPVYFLAQSFSQAKDKLSEWAKENIKRPFSVRYNSYTQTVEMLDNADSISRMVNDLRSELSVLDDALHKMR